MLTSSFRVNLDNVYQFIISHDITSQQESYLCKKKLPRAPESFHGQTELDAPPSWYLEAESVLAHQRSTKWLRWHTDIRGHSRLCRASKLH